MNSINWSPVRTFTSVMVIMTGLLTADSGWADPCTDPVEQTALDTRALQTELMVAALSCGNRIHYNAFVRKYRGDLVKHGRSLRSFFQRKHGAAGQKNLNTFITRLANEASQRSSITHAAFCANSSSLFNRLLGARPVTLEESLESSTTTSSHDIPPCGGKINTNGRTIGYGFSDSKAIVSDNLKGPK
ncbi:MAG: hypothetical protein ACREXS_05230 [Gammaproteobacteria bacterium]